MDGVFDKIPVALDWMRMQGPTLTWIIKFCCCFWSRLLCRNWRRLRRQAALSRTTGLVHALAVGWASLEDRWTEFVSYFYLFSIFSSVSSHLLRISHRHQRTASCLRWSFLSANLTSRQPLILYFIFRSPYAVNAIYHFGISTLPGPCPFHSDLSSAALLFWTLSHPCYNPGHFFTLVIWNHCPPNLFLSFEKKKFKENKESCPTPYLVNGLLYGCCPAQPSPLPRRLRSPVFRHERCLALHQASRSRVVNNVATEPQN